MEWLHNLDVGVFRCINNLALQNNFLDATMKFCAGNKLFVPMLVTIAILAIWKGGRRGRVCLFVTVVLISIGDPFIWNTIKHAIHRARPCIQLDEVRLLVGCSKSGGMPSSHAANWFVAVAVLFAYYRRSIWFMLPCALVICFSRVCCGVHYPSDVIVGAILGAGYGFAGLLALNYFWQCIGEKFFPLWHARLPSLLNPESRIQNPEADSSLTPRPSSLETHWFRLGCIVIGILFLARLAYIGSGIIELSEDETYYWLWSKQPALSYYSKPPLIAYTHLLGTKLFGDTAFGVRFFSPVITALMSFFLLRFFKRNGLARVGFWLILVFTATPILAGGAVLMTIDPLSVLFWTAAMLAGWRAIREDSKTSDWLWVGLWIGLGFLSKYTALFQFLSFAVLFALWPSARKQLKRPGPYFAVLVVLLCALPVLIWNQQHDWITVSHVAGDAKAGKPWKFSVARFLAEEAGVLNPFFFLAMLWSAVAFWRRGRNDILKIFFFSMGAPLLFVYFAYSFHSRIQPNWIAPSIVPLFCLMVIYWSDKMKSGAAWVKTIFAIALFTGLLGAVILHETDLTQKLLKVTWPAASNPLQRVRGWKETARIVGESRGKLLAEGKPVFIIANHYGTASQIAFHLREGKKFSGDAPPIYCRPATSPANQFYFWPGYENRKGENAIFVRNLGKETVTSKPPPKSLLDQFSSVTEVGIFPANYRKRVMRNIQIFDCRDLK